MAALRRAPMLILDFDETLVDADSSEWVVEQLGAASLFDELRLGQGMPWHQAMNTVLHTLHSRGVSIAHIRKAISSIPFPTQTVSVLKAAHSLGCELRILSDANTFFIQVALAHHGLDTLFTQIHSNPAWIDASGCLHYDDFHGHALPPHNCPLCPPNMCKGSILEGIRAAASEPATLQVMYAGDGSGDLCPSLQLSERDHVLPRQGYPLSKLLVQHQVKARVHPWTTLATTLHDTLLECVTTSDRDLDCVSSSLILSAASAAGDIKFQKGAALAYASHPSIGFSSQWRTAVPTTRSLYIHVLHKKYTSTHTRTSGLFKRTSASAESQSHFCSAGHAFQYHELSNSLCFSGIS